MDELKAKIGRSIANIQSYKENAGTNKAIREDYDDGRADAYAMVLGWIEEIEKN